VAKTRPAALTARLPGLIGSSATDSPLLRRSAEWHQKLLMRDLAGTDRGACCSWSQPSLIIDNQHVVGVSIREPKNKTALIVGGLVTTAAP
jgi:hypothetical protein